LFNSTFIDACNGLPTNRVPVWYMRQAGRYQAEYRQIRTAHSLIEICQDPELCARVTMLPIAQLDVDAAILFSDISIPIGAMGRAFDIKENVGPVMGEPIRTEADVDSLQIFNPTEKLPYVLEAITRLKKRLEVPLIGFAGAPFTLASYMVEGGPSREYLHTKRMMWGEPLLWQKLMAKLSDMTVTYLKAQIAAGARAVQLFDSWVGALSPFDYRQFVFPTMQRIFADLADEDVPLIYFGVGTGELLTDFGQSGANVIGIDWRVPLSQARKRLPAGMAIQGNLDPMLLQAPWPVIEDHAKRIIEEGAAKDGFIFNLGHGVPRTTDPTVLIRLTQFIHEYSKQFLSTRGES
jgi:uroporphyrinogen decarboxylase